MATSPYEAPTPSDTSQSLNQIQLFRSVSTLGDFGFSSDEILVLYKLGSAGAHRLVELYEQEGLEAADKLLGSLEGVPEDMLRDWLEAIADKKSDSDRRKRPRIPPRRLSAIDNKTEATTPATPYLRPPPGRRGSTRTTSPSPSLSTSLTHPSSEKRPRATPKSTRKQLHCPDCGNPIKNGFDKHFGNHCLPHLFAHQVPGEAELIGCGYCPCLAQEIHQGKAFLGVTSLIRHVHDVHSQPDSPAPSRLRWDFDASFKNLLYCAENIRRHFLPIVNPAAGRQSANASPSYGVPPVLSWIESDHTRQILGQLQKLAAKIDGVPYNRVPFDDAHHLDQLLKQAYYAAHKWQPSSTTVEAVLPVHQLAPASSPSQRPLRQPQQSPPSRPPLNSMGDDALNFATMGHAFDDDKHTSLRRKTPQGVRPPQSPLNRHNQAGHPNHMEGSLQRSIEPSTQHFAHSTPGTISVTSPGPARNDNFDSFSGICSELGVTEGDIFSQYTHLG